MAQILDFSRSCYKPLKTKAARLFDAILDMARDDDAAVTFTGKVMILNVYARTNNDPVLMTLSSEDSAATITILTAQLTFDYICTELDAGEYYYELHNDTDKVGVGHGPFTVL